MKYEKIIYGLGSLMIIAGAVMKILHLPFGDTILLFGFMGTSVFQTWHVIQLKKKIEEFS